MKSKKLRKVLTVTAITCLVVSVCALGAIRLNIQNGLDAWCARAQEADPHPGDDVAALIAYVQSDSHSLRDRDQAVWALGQARDERSLPVLQAFVTDAECDHSKHLCQNELEKALELSGESPVNLLMIRTPVASRRIAVNSGD